MTVVIADSQIRGPDAARRSAQQLCARLGHHPSWDLISLDDHAISPAGQMFMAQRMHAHSTAVHSAHDIMISHPAAVDQIILRAVAATT